LGIARASYFADPFSDSAMALSSGADFAVVDSYIPDAGFYKRLAERARFIAIDDLHDRGVERFALVVVNYGIGARRDFYDYADNVNCEFLIGPRYALIRAEYWDLESHDEDYVIFVPGAADVLGVSATMAEWWSCDLGPLVIALGALVSDETRGEVARKISGKANVRALRAPENFASLLAGAKFVISSASVTAYEALAMGKRVAVFSAADNQRGLGEILSGMGAAYDLGDWSGVRLESIIEAARFQPDYDSLRGLVNKRGAIACSREIVRKVT
jgi:spore coat polysaccharide biosynthesis predicted glycosyltransferase SpsG